MNVQTSKSFIWICLIWENAKESYYRYHNNAKRVVAMRDNRVLAKLSFLQRIKILQQGITLILTESDYQDDLSLNILIFVICPVWDIHLISNVTVHQTNVFGNLPKASVSISPSQWMRALTLQYWWEFTSFYNNEWQRKKYKSFINNTPCQQQTSNVGKHIFWR